MIVNNKSEDLIHCLVISLYRTLQMASHSGEIIRRMKVVRVIGTWYIVA